MRILEIWDRQRDEPPIAFECFSVYRDMLSERTIDGAYEKRSGQPARGRAARHWWTWSSRFKWLERAKAYDEYLDWVKQTSVENAMRDAGKELAKLRVEHKHSEATMSRKMASRVLDILNHPMIREKVLEKTEVLEDGKTIVNHFVIKKPARFSYNTAALLAMAASKIGRAGLDIGDDEQDIAPEDFSKQFFKTDSELAEALPEGVTPAMPSDPSAPPVLQLPAANNNVEQAAASRPAPVRPNGNGNGNGQR